MPVTRANAAELDNRIDEVAHLLLGGAARRDVHAHCAKAYGVSKRTADRMISSAYTQIAQEAAPDRAAMVNIAHGRYTRLFMKAMAANDLRAALVAQDRIVALFGLAAPTRAAIDVRVDSAQLEQVIALAEQRGTSAGELFELMITELSKSAPAKNLSDEDRERIMREGAL
jgi:hypothetical protein